MIVSTVGTGLRGFANVAGTLTRCRYAVNENRDRTQPARLCYQASFAIKPSLHAVIFYEEGSLR